MDDNKKHIVAITALIKDESGKKFLIVKRNENEIAHAGKWALPGGKAEKGEKIIDVLRREVLEEVGLEIEDFKQYIKDYTFIRPDGHNVVGLVFLVKAKTYNVKISKDFTDFKWIKPEELKNFDHIPYMEKEVEIAFAHN